MIKLCVFDVDGTLVTRGDRHICPSTIKALCQLKEAGIKLAIASGRPPFAMEKELLDQVDFDYFICSNGASVQQHNGQVLHQFQFRKEETQGLIDIFKESDNALMFQCLDAARCYHGYKRIASMLSSFLGRLDILIDKREQDHYEEEILPLAAVAKIEDKDLDTMKKQFSHLIFTPFDRYHYDINGDHSKATGIEYICKELSCSMSDVACFGDDFNDLDMILKCGYGIAMGNARDEIKAKAKYISADCDHDGIYQACLHFGWIAGENHDKTIIK